MFTSRAEHRLLLRQDNADLRLTEMGYELGLATKERYDRMLAKKTAMAEMEKAVKDKNVQPDRVNPYLEKIGTSPINQPERIAKLAVRPQVSLVDLIEYAGLQQEMAGNDTGLERITTMVEIDLKYAGYLQRESDLVDKMIELENWLIPDGFDFNGVGNITMEAREKLSKIQPDTLGQASRISGVSPADISVLMVMLKNNRKPQPVK